MNKTYLQKTWLSRKPDFSSLVVAAGSFLLLSMFCFWTWSHPDLFDSLQASHSNVYSLRQYWKLATSPFLHADLEHLLSNGLGLVIYGFLLYDYYGWLVFPLVTFIMAVLTHAVTLWFYPDDVYLVGISGMVYAMAGLWLSLFFCIDRRHTIANRTLRCMGFALVLFVPTKFEPHTSYQAHAVGMILGLICGLLIFQMRKTSFRGAEIWAEEPPEPDESEPSSSPLEK